MAKYILAKQIGSADKAALSPAEQELGSSQAEERESSVTPEERESSVTPEEKESSVTLISPDNFKVDLRHFDVKLRKNFSCTALTLTLMAFSKSVISWPV